MFEGSIFSHFHRQNFSREEWKILRNLAEDKDIVIKNADEGSCVVIWDREAYLKEADRQLSDNKIIGMLNILETCFLHLWIKVIR